MGSSPDIKKEPVHITDSILASLLYLCFLTESIKSGMDFPNPVMMTIASLAGTRQGKRF